MIKEKKKQVTFLLSTDLINDLNELIPKSKQDLFIEKVLRIAISAIKQGKNRSSAFTSWTA
jgi:hypothetical protein